MFERGPGGAQPGSASAPPQPPARPQPPPSTSCASWDVSGHWTTEQANGYHPTFDLVQRGTEVTGTAILPDAERSRAGFASATGQVAGSIRGDQLTLVVTWQRPSGPTRGRYEATVTASALERGRTLPADTPGAAEAGFRGSGRAACAR